MKQTPSSAGGRAPRWLLFFYSVPSRPVSGRVRIWRKLLRAGALPFKGAVYVLPYNEEHYEFLQWLAAEVTALKGESAFVAVERVETMEEKELVELFIRQREKEYRSLEKGLEEFERKVLSIRKGGAALKDAKLPEQLGRFVGDFEEMRKIDFFSAKAGRDLQARIRGIEEEIKGLAGTVPEKMSGIALRKRGDYQGKTWITRKKPFVDRMASAWLIRKYIDTNAAFAFTDVDSTGETRGANTVAFDLRGGEFTHIGDRCTFEVLLRSFGLKEKALRKMAEIVHELDMKDDKYRNHEAAGIEEILSGIRRTARNDEEALEKGMAVFEMLYAAKSA
ncbi:MAG: chromate resistance protein [Nitrospirales bacterium]|nr:chromate resistance protein [Nitrospirales bacterium]